MGLARVLIADDDPEFVRQVTIVLQPLVEVKAATSGLGLLSDVVLWQPDVIVFDLLLEGIDGFAVLEDLVHVAIQSRPVILCTTRGHGSDCRLPSPMTNWPVGTIRWSAGVDSMRAIIMQVLDGRSLKMNV